MKRVGILTGGGDCPGLNAVIRAVARRSFSLGWEVVGVHDGWRGLVEGDVSTLTGREVSGLLPRGGTILGTSRTNPFKVEGGVDAVLRNFAENGLDALVAIGGEDTLGVAAKLHAEHGFPVVGVPKTIDNDLSGTDYTFGFDTAVSICTEAIDRLHTTAESHNRVMVVEVMGRHTGWIAVMSGIAGGADVILIPEYPISRRGSLRASCEKRHAPRQELLDRRRQRGLQAHLRVGRAAGGDAGGRPVDAFGHVRLGGVGEQLASEIEERTGFETRVTVLGHVQRGGSPTAHDRILATRYGLKAAELVHEGSFGRMAALARRRDGRRRPRRGDRRAEVRPARPLRGRAGVLRLSCGGGSTGALRRVLVRRPPAGCSEWRALGWQAEPDPARLAAEHEALCMTLEEAGAEVVIAPPAGLDAIYAYDPALVTDAGAVLLRPGKEARRDEPEALVPELERAGVAVAGRIEPPATAEGGDFFWLAPDVLCAGRSYRTDSEGIQALERLLGCELLVFDLPHLRGPAECLHLLSLVSPLAPDLAVGYPPLMPVRLVQLLDERGIEVVEVPDEEVETLGPNVLALAPRVALLPEHNVETRRRLEAAGVETVVYRAAELSKGDGGPTCLTLPLLRS